jgi:hypothetical protein
MRGTTGALGRLQVEHGHCGEARQLFTAAFALGHGRLATMRENLRATMAAKDQTL